jgi:hypothetical protein
VRMRMWGEMMSKRGQEEFLAMIASNALGILGNVEDHMFLMVSYPCASLDWQGCTNLLFKTNEPLDDRGNISFLFKLI